MRIISTFLVLLLSLQAISQIISLEDRRSKNPVRGFQGDVGYSFSFTRNDKSIIQNGSRAKIQYNDSLNTYMAYGDMTLNQVDKEKNINKGTFGVLYNFMVPEKIMSAEAIYQYEYNDAKKLDYRHILGGGPRFIITRSKAFNLYLVGYTIYLNEKYYTNTSITNKKSLVKFSSMLSYNWKMNEDTQLSQNTYYEPDYSNPEDFRIWNETRLKINLRKNFGFNLYFKIDYESMTPKGVGNFYYTVNNSLNYTF